MEATMFVSKLKSYSLLILFLIAVYPTTIRCPLIKEDTEMCPKLRYTPGSWTTHYQENKIAKSKKQKRHALRLAREQKLCLNQVTIPNFIDCLGVDDTENQDNQDDSNDQDNQDETNDNYAQFYSEEVQLELPQEEEHIPSSSSSSQNAQPAQFWLQMFKNQKENRWYAYHSDFNNYWIPLLDPEKFAADQGKYLKTLQKTILITKYNVHYHAFTPEVDRYLIDTTTKRMGCSNRQECCKRFAFGAIKHDDTNELQCMFFLICYDKQNNKIFHREMSFCDTYQDAEDKLNKIEKPNPPGASQWMDLKFSPLALAINENSFDKNSFEKIRDNQLKADIYIYKKDKALYDSIFSGNRTY